MAEIASVTAARRSRPLAARNDGAHGRIGLEIGGDGLDFALLEVALALQKTRYLGTVDPERSGQPRLRLARLLESGPDPLDDCVVRIHMCPMSRSRPLKMRFSQQYCKMAVALFALALTAPARAETRCERGAQPVPGVVCAVDPARAQMRLFWKDADGNIFGGFQRLAQQVSGEGAKLVFAMNAGMFSPDFSPVGLYVENGMEVHPVNRRAGDGNFGMRPNGVFWIDKDKAGVTETQKFLSSNMRPAFATQSGPMLVIGGRIHPKIHPDGTSMKIRNGVGVCEDGKVRFVITDEPVTFYQFATLFRDTLHCPDALFLDGTISALYAPQLSRSDTWRAFGPIVGVVEKP